MLPTSWMTYPSAKMPTTCMFCITIMTSALNCISLLTGNYHSLLHNSSTLCGICGKLKMAIPIDFQWSPTSISSSFEAYISLSMHVTYCRRIKLYRPTYRELSQLITQFFISIYACYVLSALPKEIRPWCSSTVGGEELRATLKPNRQLEQ